MFQTHIGLIRKVRISAMFAGVLLCAISILAVFPVGKGSDDTLATSPKQSETVLQLSTDNLVLDFELDSLNGSFDADSTELTVSTNNVTGYSLSIVTGNTGDDAGKLVGENKSFNSISSATSEEDFAAANATAMNGLWGYKPSKIDGESNTNYLPAPTAAATIETTNSAAENTYTIGLGARADFSYEAGAYTNTFVITAVSNPVGYTITYDKNTEDEVNNMPAQQSGMTSEQTVTLSSSEPTREGYEFSGWCDGVVSGTSCTGTTYQPGDSYEIDQQGTNAVILKALWEEDAACNPSATDIDDAVCMQDMNSDVASTMVTEQQYQLVDSRDGKEYWISKLADGNIWMTQNLDLDLNSNVALSSEDSDINVFDDDNESYSTENGVIYWTPEKSTTDISNGDIPDDADYEARSSDVGNWYFTGIGLTSSQQNYLTGNAGNYFSTSPSLTNGTHGHVGNYYNWYAAIANGDAENSRNTYNSICPAGWRLPKSSRDPNWTAFSAKNCGNYTKDVEECLTVNDLYGLIYNYNDGGLFGGLGFENSPAYLTRAGTVSGTALKNAGYDGYYWTSQSFWNTDTIFELMYRSSASDAFDAIWSIDKRQRSVRCVANASEPNDDYEFSVIYFDGNGATDFEDAHYGTHSDSLASQLIKRGGTANLRPNKYTKYGEEFGCDDYCSFLGWNTERDGSGTFYTDRASFSTSDDEITLYAQWETDFFRVDFDSNGGGEGMDSLILLGEETIDLPINTLLSPNGYEFDYWASSADGARPYYEDGASFTAPASTSGEAYKVLYAMWKPTGTPTPTGGESGTGTGVTLQRAYEMAYTAMHKGMYEEDTAGSNTFHYVDSWNGGTYQGEGRDVRFLIQDMTPEICATATDIGSTALVLDIRDQTSYRIVKAADGRCWMQDNMALNLLDSTVQTTMINNPSYTNADAASLTSLFSGNRTNGGNYATAGVSNWTSSYSYSAPLINVSNKDVLPTTYEGTDEPLASTVASEKWKVGVYYNYCAASAGSYCYGSGTSQGSSVDKANTAIDAEYDICPSGWRMPTGSSYDATARPDGGEYQTLYDAYTGTSGTGEGSEYANFRKSLRLPLSGDFDGTTFGQGSVGAFWSSTYYGSSYMYSLDFYTSYIYPRDLQDRHYGHSVRCVAKTGTEPAPTPVDPDPDTTTFDEAYAAAGKTKDATSNKYKMQDMSTSICDAVTTPTNTTDYRDTPETQLVDIRDGKIYWVAKLMDGKCWMTQNLDLDLESTATNVTALTSENTDLNTYGSNGYDSINGYSQANNVIAWTPERSSTSTISTSGSISNWTNDYNNPYSVDPGDWYWIGNWDNNGSFTWYVSTENNYLNTADSGAGDKFSQDPYTGNGAHGHVGNYYNWPAAVASNNTSSYTMSTYDNITNNPQNSICPAHWRLPTAYSTATDTRNEIQYLLDRYGAYVESGSERDKAITAAPLWFVRGGFVQNINPYGIIQSGHSGYYWSSTVDSVTQYSSGAYALYFNSGNQFYPARALRRDYGFTIRCVVR